MTTELDKAIEIIERDQFLLSVTTIEDWLQNSIPDTIHALQEGEIKSWMLTGDRQETAISIELSSSLIGKEIHY